MMCAYTNEANIAEQTASGIDVDHYAQNVCPIVNPVAICHHYTTPLRCDGGFHKLTIVALSRPCLTAQRHNSSWLASTTNTTSVLT